MILDKLTLPKGANRRKKRVGRGVGSGHGKTSTRGSKGLFSRSGGKLRHGFEGGQMPLIRRIPKRGFTGRQDNIYQVINIGALNIIKQKDVITPEELVEYGLIKDRYGLIKILGGGEISRSLTVKAQAFSASAKEKIEKAGGKAEIIKKVQSARCKVQS